MAHKTKINKTADVIKEAATNAGILLMTAAVTTGLMEMPNHPDRRVVVPNQPAVAMASQPTDQPGQGSQLRREREEVGPHYVSYSVTQRTPGRTGKI